MFVICGSKFDELECNEVDHNLPNRLINKYYYVGEVQKLNTSKNFNIFHSNVNGLESKMDLLREFLSSTSDFDVIAISESSQRNNDFLKNNVAIKIKATITILHLHTRKKVMLLSMQRIN